MDLAGDATFVYSTCRLPATTAVCGVTKSGHALSTGAACHWADQSLTHPLCTSGLM